MTMGTHDDDRPPHLVGTRQRGARLGAGVSVLFDDEVTVAVGLDAACTAIDRPGREPAGARHAEPARLRKPQGQCWRCASPERPIAVLFREPAMADQLALIDAVLPAQARASASSPAPNRSRSVSELQRAAQGWDLQIEYAPDPKSLAAALAPAGPAAATR